MNEPWRNSIDVPSREEADAAVRDAETLLRTTLATWASDLLVLRRAGVTGSSHRGSVHETANSPAWRRAA